MSESISERPAAGLTKEEVYRIAKEVGVSVKLMYYVRKLVEAFETPRLFLEAKDADYKRMVRYGEGLATAVTKVKERCYFYLENEKARLELDERVKAYIEKLTADRDKELEKLDSVFSQADMENITLYMREAHLEYIDIRTFNEFRHSITAGQVEMMRRRHEKEEAERKERERLELEKLQEKDGAEKERAEKERREKEKTEKDKPEKQEKGRKDGKR